MRKQKFRKVKWLAQGSTGSKGKVFSLLTILMWRERSWLCVDQRTSGKPDNTNYHLHKTPSLLSTKLGWAYSYSIENVNWPGDKWLLLVFKSISEIIQCLCLTDFIHLPFSYDCEWQVSFFSQLSKIPLCVQIHTQTFTQIFIHSPLVNTYGASMTWIL